MMQTVIDAGFAASILSRYAGALPAPVLPARLVFLQPDGAPEAERAAPRYETYIQNITNIARYAQENVVVNLHLNFHFLNRLMMQNVRLYARGQAAPSTSGTAGRIAGEISVRGGLSAGGGGAAARGEAILRETVRFLQAAGAPEMIQRLAAPAGEPRQENGISHAGHTRAAAVQRVPAGRPDTAISAPAEDATRHAAPSALRVASREERIPHPAASSDAAPRAIERTAGPQRPVTFTHPEAARQAAHDLGERSRERAAVVNRSRPGEPPAANRTAAPAPAAQKRAVPERGRMSGQPVLGPSWSAAPGEPAAATGRILSPAAQTGNSIQMQYTAAILSAAQTAGAADTAARMMALSSPAKLLLRSATARGAEAGQRGLSAAPAPPAAGAARPAGREDGGHLTAGKAQMQRGNTAWGPAHAATVAGPAIWPVTHSLHLAAAQAAAPLTTLLLGQQQPAGAAESSRRATRQAGTMWGAAVNASMGAPSAIGAVSPGLAARVSGEAVRHPASLRLYPADGSPGINQRQAAGLPATSGAAGHVDLSGGHPGTAQGSPTVGRSSPAAMTHRQAGPQRGAEAPQTMSEATARTASGAGVQTAPVIPPSIVHRRQAVQDGAPEQPADIQTIRRVVKQESRTVETRKQTEKNIAINAPPPLTAPVAEQKQSGQVPINQLADQVYQVIEKRLRSERLRRGGF